MVRKQNLSSIPANLVELNERIALVGELSRDLAQMKSLTEAKIAGVKLLASAEQAPVAERLERELVAIEKYAEGNRASLLIGEAKSISFAAGRIGWRMTPLRVAFLKNGAEKALAFLKERRMKKYIRYIAEVDKEALLRDQPEVDGVKYRQQDEFFVEPNVSTTKVEAIGEAVIVTK